MSDTSTSLRRELLLAFAVLFAGGVLVAGVGIILAYPLLDSPRESTLYLVALLLGDLAIVFFFGRAFLRRFLLEPIDALVHDTRRIAEGDYRHRARLSDAQELRSLAESVNAMADRLIEDQTLLAENVASLERTNRELVEARDEVIRAARLASVGSLAAGIAHEVGNPLGAMLGYVDVARRRARSDGRDPELLDQIREEAQRIDRIVRGLLDYARPKVREPGPTELKGVIHRVRDLLERQGRLEGIDAIWEVEEDVPPVIMDAQRMEQVLVNLLLNATDALEGALDARVAVRLATEPGGAARLPIRRESDPAGINYAHRRRVAPEAAGQPHDPLWTAPEVVVVTVEDNGHGIPPDDLDRIFDPFFTTKEPGKGTGLGLSVCDRLVEGIGGRIVVENRKEGGARFRVRLPAAAEVSAPDATPATTAAGGSGEER
ncbi:MAG: HAMP domain-containing protein [Gemmatimonadetes bacterium]|nr:HAMP domain-containing protein [Gemmatimonadota bacterium]NIR79011.1 HAMP domain-containing protein [Gemmatimonadota bacterium]NIT87655.1 HAMP domain-containing protein [Gemmatimonadota bacterium]NIU31522.1 HAMP domain-containing protein [Gemmatimonadota bacterium]NIU36182.1 HAMP domain-containing protein [Gemmatimonadota bacterium]